jgi:CRP-like cAMP-binding protein
MPQHRDNLLLNLLEPDVFNQIEPQLSIIDLQREQVLAETHQRIEKVYFPHSGIISCVVELKGGGAIETGMIGRDGTFGASQALDDKVSLNHVVIQLAGTASLMASNHLRQQAEAHDVFRAVLIKYDQFFLAQVQQHVACNAVHTVQARTCKWLLRMHELVGSDLLLTQQFLAQMMGVTRTSVTIVAGELQKAGMITYSRGRVHIIDIAQIQKWACECEYDIRSHYRRIFSSNEE